MRRFFQIAAVVPMVAVGAMAQDDPVIMKQRLDKLVSEATIVSVMEGVSGQPVKGEPYSATEVNENTQVLADGTKIHNESQTQIYRDGQGRVRREMPGEVTISDPVASVRYVLHPDTQTATKMQIFKIRRDSNGRGEEGDRVFVFAGGRGETGAPASPPQPVTMQFRTMTADGGRGPAGYSLTLDGQTVNTTPQKEDLGQQAIEGVNSKGTRVTNTIPAGAIGNDREIKMVTETWISPDLQIPMMRKTTDPRSGEHYFHLTNVRLGEPDPSLFQVPTGWQVSEGPTAPAPPPGWKK